MIHLFDLGSRRARKRTSRRTRMARRSHRCSMLQMTSVEAVPVVLTFWGVCYFSQEAGGKRHEGIKGAVLVVGTSFLQTVSNWAWPHVPRFPFHLLKNTGAPSPKKRVSASCVLNLGGPQNG